MNQGKKELLRLDGNLLRHVKDKVWISKTDMDIQVNENMQLKYYADDCVQIFDHGDSRLVITSQEAEDLIVALIAARQIWDFPNE